MDQNEVNFWELSASQWNSLAQYFQKNSIELPGFFGLFEEHEGFYYLEQTPENLRDYDSLFQDFDMDDGELGNSFGTRTWTKSTVPSALWP